MGFLGTESGGGLDMGWLFYHQRLWPQTTGAQLRSCHQGDTKCQAAATGLVGCIPRQGHEFQGPREAAARIILAGKAAQCL